jgi:hypothetical protein
MVANFGFLKCWHKALIHNADLPVCRFSLFPHLSRSLERQNWNRSRVQTQGVVHGFGYQNAFRTGQNPEPVRSELGVGATPYRASPSMTEFAKLRITSATDDAPPGSGAVRLADLDPPPSQRAGDPPPGSGAVRLDDFLNPPPPALPLLRQAFEAEVARVMQIHGLSRPAAERAAFENAVVDHMNATHPGTLSDRCAHCSKFETPGRVLLPIGTGPHAWLHNDCWEAWRADRRAKAIAALAEAGVGA